MSVFRSRPFVGFVAAAVGFLIAVIIRFAFWQEHRSTDVKPAPTTRVASSDYKTTTIKAMGTKISAMVPAGWGDRANRALAQVFEDVESKMSEWRKSSPLSAVNRAAGQRPVAVPKALIEVIKRGIEIGEQTDGAFDISWAALWGLWDFKKRPPRVPEAEKVKQAVALVNFREIVVDEAARTIKLPRAGMKIGLGGIAKGYALDRAADRLQQLGLDSFMLLAGGQVLTRGKRGDRSWRVGIRDPRGARDDYFAKLDLQDRCISTSGDYERSFILDKVRYHHILDPRTGMPARAGIRSASVIAGDATVADALSTALLIMGNVRALALVEQMQGVEAVIVDDDAEVHQSRGMAGLLEIERAPRR